MPLVRKRRALNEDPESDDSSETPATQRRQKRREDTSPEAEDSDEGNSQAATSLNTMVQKMVRLALSSEFARLPIRRADVSAKVLGEQGTRQFKPVFESAQRVLQSVFGMEMIELPAREKVTISQRRAAQKSEKPSSTNKSWILTSTLPRAYRVPEILPPTHAPSIAIESTYTALYSFIIAVISLNGGSLGEQKLERYLARMNADTYTPIERTDKFLQHLVKEGYLDRMRENDGGEEIVEYMVGPRGKVEVGSGGVAGLAREVYGYGLGSIGEEGLTVEERKERDEFEARLRRSLGITAVREEDEERDERANEIRNAAGVSRRSSRRANAHEEESEEEEDDHDSD